MPIQSECVKDERVVIYTITDPFDFTDFRAAQAIDRVIFDRADQPVHSIVDLRGVRAVSSNLLTLFGRKSHVHHANAGTTVVVTENPLIGMMVNIAGRLLPSGKLYCVGALETAWESIEATLAAEAMAA